MRGIRIGLVRAVACCVLLLARAHAVLSPYSLHPADYTLAGAGVAVRGFAEWIDYQRSSDTTDYHQLSPNTIPRYDRWCIGYYSRGADITSTILTVGEFAIPLAVNAWDIHTGTEPQYGVIADLIIYTEVYCFSSSAAVFAKALRVHPRPLAFTDKAPVSQRRSGDARSSFFSAHTTSAFASAAFTGYTFQLKHPESPLVPWVWSGMLGMASTVGALRIFSGKHFLSDVVTGAVVGSAFGYGIPLMHVNKTAKRINKQESQEEESGIKIDLGVDLASADGTPIPVVLVNF